MPLPNDPAEILVSPRVRRILRRAAFALLLLVAVGGLRAEYEEVSTVLLPGLAVLTALLAFCPRYIITCAGVAAAVIVANTVLSAVFSARTFVAAFEGLLPTETLVVLVLILLASWRLSKGRAVAVVLVLVGISALSISVRVAVHPQRFSAEQGFVIGAMQLTCAAGVGMYLRNRRQGAATHPLLRQLNAQLPTVMLLVLALLYQVTALGQTAPAEVLVMLAALTTSGLALLSTPRPVEATLLGSVTVVVLATAMWLLGQDAAHSNGSPIPMAVVVAGLVLTMNVVRRASLVHSFGAVCAELAAVVFALLITPNNEPNLGRSLLVVAAAIAFVLAAAAGTYLRWRDRERRLLVQAAITDAQHNERMALARELHDIVAHHVTGIVVQAQAASMVAEQSPRTAAEALEGISGSGTEALAAMRRLVASMRAVEPAGSPRTTEHATVDLVADLHKLVDGPRESAARVDLNTDITGSVPQEVARSGLRLVQEAVTNSEKHALDVTTIQVAVQVADDRLNVRVADDGSGTRATPPGGSGGYGLVGMRERVELLGGKLFAGPGEHIGWRVDAWLPMTEGEYEPR